MASASGSGSPTQSNGSVPSYTYVPPPPGAGAGAGTGTAVAVPGGFPLAGPQGQGMFQYMPVMPQYVPRQYFCIDVECVATGPKHNDRAVAQIALVDEREQVLLNLYVKPEKPVVSYITPLTGLSKEILDHYGMPLAQALQFLRQHLPPTAILVGQNITADISWLSLVEGRDFASIMDLSGCFRAYNAKFKNYSYFSLAHEARALLGLSPDTQHNAVNDAVVSMKLFSMYRELQSNEQEWEKAKQRLLQAAPEPSFAKNHPTFEGVCMGNKVHTHTHTHTRTRTCFARSHIHTHTLSTENMHLRRRLLFDLTHTHSLLFSLPLSLMSFLL